MELQLFLSEDSPYCLLLLLMRLLGLGWIFFILLQSRVKQSFFLAYGAYSLLQLGLAYAQFPIYYLFLFAEPFWLAWLVYRKSYESFRFSAYLVALIYLGFDLFRGFFLFCSHAMVGNRLFSLYHPLLYGLVVLLAIHTIVLLFQLYARYLPFIDDWRFRNLVSYSFILFAVIHILLTLSQVYSCSFLSIGCSGLLRSISLYIFLILILRIRLRLLQFEKEKIESNQMMGFCQKMAYLYQDLRGFRHDFSGILVGFRCAIESRDWKQVEKFYQEVLVEAKMAICSQAVSYLDVHHLEDKGIQSLVLNFLCRAEQMQLKVGLEIRKPIAEVSVNRLALIRLLSILLTNALEAAQESEEKRIQLTFLKTDEGLQMILENSRIGGDLDIVKIYQSDWSTKGQGRGLGLYTVQRILNHETAFLLDTEIGVDYFIQQLTIRS